MASPQPTRNFARISNEILEAEASHRISSAEARLLNVVLRETWGRPGAPKMAPLSNAVIGEKMGIGSKFASEVVQRLRRRNLLRVEVDGAARLVGIQKDHETWLDEDPARRAKKKRVRERQLPLPLEETYSGCVRPGSSGSLPPVTHGSLPVASPNQSSDASPLNGSRLEKTSKEASPRDDARRVAEAAFLRGLPHLDRTAVDEAARDLIDSLEDGLLDVAEEVAARRAHEVTVAKKHTPTCCEALLRFKCQPELRDEIRLLAIESRALKEHEQREDEAALDRETQRRLKKAGPSPPSSAALVSRLAEVCAKPTTKPSEAERRKALLAQLAQMP